MRKLLILIILLNCFLRVSAKKESLTDQYVKSLKQVTDIMVNDVASPVAASRYYAYITLATYEIQSLYSSIEYPSLKGIINGYSGLTISRDLMVQTDENLAVLLSIFRISEKLLPSGFTLKHSGDSLIKTYQGSRKINIERTRIFVDSVVRQFMLYVKNDKFNTLNNLPRYVLTEGDGFWKPTPPVFMAPIEPHWNKVRPFFLDSAQQFKVLLPAPYDTTKNSSYYKQLLEVYNYGKKASEEEKAIANFWDCNPFAVQQIGHIEFGLKKISPGGHWIGIGGIACKQVKLDLRETVRVHAFLSIVLADAFIACWDEKYRSNRIRPETAIQKLIDPRWRPLLQTPPFPEYVSGHSVASNAAAEILTVLLGDSISFNDDTEVEFGLPIRSFANFNQAASEASISRLYGGIHYRDAIEQGIWQGREVARLLIKKMNIISKPDKVSRK